MKLTQAVGFQMIIQPNTEAEGLAHCPAGSRVTGGGALTSNRSMNITTSYPQDVDTWRVYVTNTGTTASSAFPHALCMSIEPAGAFTTAKKGLIPAKVKKALKKRR